MVKSLNFIAQFLCEPCNRKIINWVQCLNRNRALTVPDTAQNGIEFGAVKA